MGEVWDVIGVSLGCGCDSPPTQPWLYTHKYIIKKELKFEEEVGMAVTKITKTRVVVMEN